MTMMMRNDEKLAVKWSDCRRRQSSQNREDALGMAPSDSQSTAGR
jgi:hypothetical protein